jgi:D-cysteine desulfhydrase family pyridoxal phosphate-dependent enzyme
VTSAIDRLSAIPRRFLGAWPTPLTDAPNLAAHLGLKRILVKRDDCTTLGGGGNKVRKLEFLMADALGKGADTVITCGGIQSNHARLTAAAANAAGIPRSILVLGGPLPDSHQGNLILDAVLGAEVRLMADATVKDMIAEMDAIAEGLRAHGSNPYVIPLGGSSALGDMGYVECMRELASQLDGNEAPTIVTAVGSGGTLIGCAVGLKLFLPKARLIGISVTGKAESIVKHLIPIAKEASCLLGLHTEFVPDDLPVFDGYYGKQYGVPSELGNQAILTAARSEGLILDPVYTGKAMSGLIDLAQRGEIDPSRPVVFIHTGGMPGLFAFEEMFEETEYSGVGSQ